MKVKPLCRVQLLATPWTVAHQAPPSMRFFRQECWSGVPLPSPALKKQEPTNNQHRLQASYKLTQPSKMAPSPPPPTPTTTTPALLPFAHSWLFAKPKLVSSFETDAANLCSGSRGFQAIQAKAQSWFGVESSPRWAHHLIYRSPGLYGRTSARRRKNIPCVCDTAVTGRSRDGKAQFD